MIVSIAIGEDIEVVLDDECAEMWNPARASELCHHAVTVLAEALAACKASSNRTVKARQR